MDVVLFEGVVVLLEGLWMRRMRHGGQSVIRESTCERVCDWHRVYWMHCKSGCVM